MTNSVSKTAVVVGEAVKTCVANVHPSHASCAVYALLLFKDGLKQSVKIYVPLYIASTVVSMIRRK